MVGLFDCRRRHEILTFQKNLYTFVKESLRRMLDNDKRVDSFTTMMSKENTHDHVIGISYDSIVDHYYFDFLISWSNDKCICNADMFSNVRSKGDYRCVTCT